MEYYQAIRWDKFESALVRRLYLDPVIQNKVSQKQKKKSYINAYIWNLEKMVPMNVFEGSSRDTNREQTCGHSGERRRHKLTDQHGNARITTCETDAALCSVAQSRPTLGHPMDCSLPGSTVLGDSPGKNTGVEICHMRQGAQHGAL